MKKPFKLIIIGALLLILVGVLKSSRHEDLTATADISEELSQESLASRFESKSVDFSRCEEQKVINFPNGNTTNKLKILGIQAGHCLVETTFESAGGYYTNDCQIPLETGLVTFKDPDFIAISEFCQIKTEGVGLLELE